MSYAPLIRHPAVTTTTETAPRRARAASHQGTSKDMPRIARRCEKLGFATVNNEIAYCLDKAREAVSRVLPVVLDLANVPEAHQGPGSLTKTRGEIWRSQSYVCWFGDYDGNRFALVIRTLRRIHDILHSSSLKIRCDPLTTATATVSKGILPRINLGEGWKNTVLRMNKGETGARPGGKSGFTLFLIQTLIHEAAHLAGANYGGDYPEVYHRSPAGDIAKVDPEHAVHNAENYGWFVLDGVTPRDRCISIPSPAATPLVRGPR